MTYRSPKDDHFDRGDLIIQQPYRAEGDMRWYVQEIALLDMGRFNTWDEAYNHYKFLRESKTST